MKWIVALLLIWGAWVLLRKPARPREPANAALDDARALLGVDARADDEAIRLAHRRLAASVHPDRGGSAELARQVNAARDLLLKRHD